MLKLLRPCVWCVLIRAIACFVVLSSAPANAEALQGDPAVEPRKPPAIRTAFSGFVDAQVYGYPQRATRHDDPAASWLTAFVRQELTTPRVQFVASLSLEHISSGEQETPPLLDFADRRARRAPLSIPEAWLRVRLARALDVQAGRFEPGWGRTDGYSPGSSFLARDFSDPLVDRRLPLWGVRLQGERGPVRFELFHSFVTTPWRLPVMLGRFSPGGYAGVYLLDPIETPPTRGFDMARVTVSGRGWDVGAWMRSGVRPAPLLELQEPIEETRPPEVFIGLRRRFVDERAYGAEAVRVLSGWIVRGELGYSESPDPAVDAALLWTVEVERPARNGAIVVSAAGNALDSGDNAPLVLDRRLLPYFVASTTQLETWGSWRVLWLGTIRRAGGLLQLEIARALTDVVKLTVGTDLPHGSRTSSPGAISKARRVRAGLRWSW